MQLTLVIDNLIDRWNGLCEKPDELKLSSELMSGLIANCDTLGRHPF